MKRTRVYVRSADGNINYEIEAFSSLNLTLNWNAVSTWSITCPVTPAALELALPGSAIIIDGDGFSLSGPQGSRDRVLASQQDSSSAQGNNSDSSGTDYITLSGVSDDTYLWERLCWPCLPTQQSPGIYFFADATNDSRSGAAETVMYAYAKANLGGAEWSNGPWSVRQVPGLLFGADQGRGNTVSGAPRFDVLGDYLAILAQAGGGLGFGITDLQMWITQSTDRSDEIEFSTASGSIVAYEYQSSAPSVTDVVCAGQDDGTNRICAIGGDPVAAGAWRRIEAFVDSSSTPDVATLQQNLQNALTNGAATAKLSATILPTDAMRFGYDYQLGDVVSYVIDGSPGQDVLRQVNITIDQNGFIIAPTIQNANTSGVSSSLQILNTVKDIQRRLSLLERAQ